MIAQSGDPIVGFFQLRGGQANFLFGKSADEAPTASDQSDLGLSLSPLIFFSPLPEIE
jgi:hypothetical protein